jgi:hypothetical protein
MGHPSLPEGYVGNGDVGHPPTSATFTGTLGMSPGFGFNYSQTNSTVTNAGRVNPVLYPTIPTIQATFNVDSYSTSDF